MQNAECRMMKGQRVGGRQNHGWQNHKPRISGISRMKKAFQRRVAKAQRGKPQRKEFNRG
jgi:hypothetical protein